MKPKEPDKKLDPYIGFLLIMFLTMVVAVAIIYIKYHAEDKKYYHRSPTLDYVGINSNLGFNN